MAKARKPRQGKTKKGTRSSYPDTCLTAKQTRRAKRSKRNARLASQHTPQSSAGAGAGNSCPGEAQPTEQFSCQIVMQDMKRNLNSLDFELINELGRAQPHVDAVREYLELSPEDPTFLRTFYLCMLMGMERHHEAKELLDSALFHDLLLIGAPGDGNTARKQKSLAKVPAWRMAKLAGHFSLALTTFLHIQASNRDSDPTVHAVGEKLFQERLWKAHEQNPYVAEFIAFAPAFELHFVAGQNMPLPSAPAEAMMVMEALRYCVTLGQSHVWLSVGQEVRSSIRAILFESAPQDGDWDSPPLRALPDVQCAVVSTWKLAREDALELWSAEISLPEEME